MHIDRNSTVGSVTKERPYSTAAVVPCMAAIPMKDCHYTGQSRKDKQVSCKNTMTFKEKQPAGLGTTLISSR